MEVVGVVFIATNYFLVVAPFLDRGRSAPLVQTLRPCTSTAEIATVSSNGYINSYKCIKCVIRCQIE
jgi:hypothetical protein